MQPPKNLQTRTKQFALGVIKLVDTLPNGRAADVIVRQLLTSATSGGANCRSTQLGQSFRSKLGIVAEECYKSLYLLELLAESGMVKQELLGDLMREANEIIAMVVALSRIAGD